MPAAGDGASVIGAQATKDLGHGADAGEPEERRTCSTAYVAMQP